MFGYFSILWIEALQEKNLFETLDMIFQYFVVALFLLITWLSEICLTSLVALF